MDPLTQQLGRRLGSFYYQQPARTEKPDASGTSGREWVMLLPYFVLCGLRREI